MGGLDVGYLTNRWGFRTTFTAEALLLVLWPLSGLLLMEKKTPKTEGRSFASRIGKCAGAAFFLPAAKFLISVSSFVLSLALSPIMSEMAFPTMAISSTGIVADFGEMPLPLMTGWLSDLTDPRIAF